MLVDAGFFAIFLVGLLGGTHCVGMCGGIVTALSLQLPGKGLHFFYHIAYSLGRITSYTVAGAIAGAVGSSALLLQGFLPVQQGLYVLANLMLVMLGLYLAGVWHAVLYFERIGGFVWKRLQPFMGRLLPVKSVPRALVVGAIWGWLPCGLVYSVIVSALASGSAVHGGLLMLAFGLGTLPNLLIMGLFAQRLKSFMQSQITRLAAGLLVAGFGVWGLVRFVMS